jgi:SAM-dependent methyltransferase
LRISAYRAGVVDRLFSLPQLAQLYDPLHPDRPDLTMYLALLQEVGARSVLDVGCGTGTFALMLARHGFTVIGLDPAEASLDIARRKPGSEFVRWLRADACSRQELAVDAVTMTGNVAQVFLDDHEWATAQQSAWQALRPGGCFIFESRDPDARAWHGWTRQHTTRTARVEGVGEVSCWEDVTAVEWPTVSFDTTFCFPDGSVVTSSSTLRFRSRDEILTSLEDAGFAPATVRDAPDRPGQELVIIAARPSDSQ